MQTEIKPSGALGRCYADIKPVDATGCKLFVMRKASAMPSLPAPRTLMAGEYREVHGRQTGSFLDARITTGFWIWKRTVDILIWRKSK